MSTRPGAGAADGALSRRGHGIRVPRLDPIPCSRPQGGRRSRSRVAQRARRPRARARRPPGHRGDRRRSLADPVRAGRAARGRRLRRRTHLVSHERRQSGQPCAVSRARATRRPRRAAAQLAREPRRRADPERRPGELRRPGVRHRARDGARRHAGGARAGAGADTPGARRVHRVPDVLRDGRRRRAPAPRSPMRPGRH